MENSGLDKNTLLKTQKEMLLLKKQRLERIIGSIEAYSKRYQAALQKLASLKNYNINTFEVKEIVGELEFITRQLYQLNDASSFMLETAKLYKQDENLQKVSDQTLGQGAAKFIGEAIEAFYHINTCLDHRSSKSR